MFGGNPKTICEISIFLGLAITGGLGVFLLEKVSKQNESTDPDTTASKSGLGD